MFRSRDFRVFGSRLVKYGDIRIRIFEELQECLIGLPSVCDSAGCGVASGKSEISNLKYDGIAHNRAARPVGDLPELRNGIVVVSHFLLSGSSQVIRADIDVWSSVL